jgi:hypothetical protein
MFGNGTLVDLPRFDKVVQARTKVPSKGPVRHAGDQNQRSGTSLGSIGAARAHLRAHAHQATLARSPTPRFGNLKLSNTFPIDARQALETSRTCARTKLSDPRFGSHCRGLLPKVFILKIFNWTFLLILIGSRRDLIKHQRRSWPLFDFHHASSINCFELGPCVTNFFSLRP